MKQPVPSTDRATSPVLPHVWRGTVWLALKSPLQVIIAFWSIPLIQHAIGAEANGAYVFAWGLGFVQFLLEFGMGSALQRQMSHAWTSGDHDAVDRLTACGLAFYGAVGIVQAGVLLGVAYLGLPQQFQGQSRDLIIGLLWIQALSAPLFGVLTVASSVLQAARRYEFLPRLDPLLMIVRFLILIVGLWARVSFVVIVALQTVVLLGGMLVPALWVMVRELGCLPRFTRVRAADLGTLLHIGFYVFLMQLSVVLADKVDTTILGYALPDADPGPAITVYQNVSKPFFQIRQTGWTLAYLVVPAVASLAAAKDHLGLQKLKYDGTRFLVGLLLPIAILASIYAAPFLSLWVGPRYAPSAPLLRLFLVAALPLVLSVHAQMAIGLGKLKVVSLSPLLGSLVNVPLSYYLTMRLGVAGVIWGTVATTLISNLLVPGIYLFGLLEIRLPTFLTRTLGPPLAGAALLVPAAWICSTLVPPEPMGTTFIARSAALVFNLSVCVAAYLVGYMAVGRGRSDLTALGRQLRQRWA